MINIRLDPVPKPRMTASDRWKHRPIVDKYFKFKDALVGLTSLGNFKLGNKYKIEFLIKMPDSWSEAKKKKNEGKPHQIRPDLDNLIKAVNDCLKDEDKAIYHIEASKVWWKEGRIIIHNKR